MSEDNSEHQEGCPLRGLLDEDLSAGKSSMSCACSTEDMRVYVRIDAEFTVELPEAGKRAIDDGGGELTDEARRRSVEAVLSFITGRAEIYLDGDDEAPVVVDGSDIGDYNIEGARAE